VWHDGESVEEDEPYGYGQGLELTKGHHLPKGAYDLGIQRRRNTEHKYQFGSEWAGRR
jgi:hypothetical protein